MPPDYPQDLQSNVEKLSNYDEMVELAKELSCEFPYVRVGMYSVNGKTIFGEMTFSKGAGFDKIRPRFSTKNWAVGLS